ncbi:MAG: holo-ACP synthase [Clostridia bacterium]|nr:holo-ACP synthase [Clostridia bacterium]
MNLKIGNDIIETERIKKILSDYPEKFKTRVFTEKEVEYCESKGENKYQSYAARFAAKEAIFKAISDLLPNKFDIQWTDIEILNNEAGRPFATVKNVNQIEQIDISISHVKEYAIATALVMITN